MYRLTLLQHVQPAVDDLFVVRSPLEAPRRQLLDAVLGILEVPQPLLKAGHIKLSYGRGPSSCSSRHRQCRRLRHDSSVGDISTSFSPEVSDTSYGYHCGSMIELVPFKKFPPQVLVQGHPKAGNLHKLTPPLLPSPPPDRDSKM